MLLNISFQTKTNQIWWKQNFSKFTFEFIQFFSTIPQQRGHLTSKQYVKKNYETILTTYINYINKNNNNIDCIWFKEDFFLTGKCFKQKELQKIKYKKTRRKKILHVFRQIIPKKSDHFNLHKLCYYDNEIILQCALCIFIVNCAFNINYNYRKT